MKFHQYLAKNSIIGLLSLLVTLLILAGCVYFYMELQLPDVDTLKDARMQVPLRIYSSDNQLIGEYGGMRRVPVTLNQVPKPLIDALIATEDRRFFEHPGVDFIGLLRASKELVITGQKTQGASTITMQVARNFFLTPKKTFSRKINEILLALKLNSTFSKDKILELYLNKIYLGQHAYGVASAAQIYYGKTLNQLTLPEMAMIAGLPQAPSRDNPIVNPTAAKDRRNHVLERMLEDGYINTKTYKTAIAAADDASYHGPRVQVQAPYVAEMVRNVIAQEYGDAAYTDGLQVYTTISSHLQQQANTALRNGVLAYDQRHGYRGAEKHLDGFSSTWRQKLATMTTINGLLPAAVTTVSSRSLQAMLANGQTINIPWAGLSWARKSMNNGQYLGSTPKNAGDVAKSGDVIRVQKNTDGQWQLSQLPNAESAIVSMNPNDGAILALTGGFDYERSNWNRVIQANRQPGSNFKPFIYAAALAKGYTLATIINDAPVVINDTGHNLWRPQNDDLKFYGPTRLRLGLVRSQNLTSIRLLQLIGLDYAINYAGNFGFDPKTLPHGLSLALGTANLTPLQMVTGYSVFANGGYRVTPYFIQQVKDDAGRVIYSAHPTTVCNDCAPNITQMPTGNQVAPRVINADVAYLMTVAMQDVIQEGTAKSAKIMNRADIAGKTGSANNQIDAWFSGFNHNIVTTVWVGFDDPRSLYEYGAKAALPIWIQFMEAALKDQPEAVMQQPNDIVSVRINPATGLLASADEADAIFEVFRKEYVPTQSGPTGDQTSSFAAGNNADAQLF